MLIPAPDFRRGNGIRMTTNSHKMTLRVRGWQQLQHYRNRRPPWIKLHRDLLDDMGWHRLPDASKALAPMIWLLASERPGGTLETNVQHLAFRLRATAEWVEAALAPLIADGFLCLEQVASTLHQVGSAPEQGASSESESEGETETEAQTEAGASPGSGSAQRSLATLGMTPLLGSAHGAISAKLSSRVARGNPRALARDLSLRRDRSA